MYTLILLMTVCWWTIALSLAFCPIPEANSRDALQGRRTTVISNDDCVVTTRKSLVACSSSSKGGGGNPNDFFSVYNDDELWNVLNIHRQLTTQQQQQKQQEDSSAASSSTTPANKNNDNDDDDDGVRPNMSIHESFLKTQGGEATMERLLDLHKSVVTNEGETNELLPFDATEQVNSQNDDVNDADSIIPPSLHDLVQQAVGEGPTAVNKDETTICTDDATTAVIEPIQLLQANRELLDKVGKIRAIASDVDGTLLTSQQTVHPRSRQAVLRAVQESSNVFFLATGKSRKGALGSVGIELTALLEDVPGVFLQGLYCVNKDGRVVFEKKLSRDAVEAVEQLARECNVSLVAYDGDELYSTGSLTGAVKELSERYGEPTVISLSTTLAEYEPGFHKVLLIDDNADRLSTTVRPQLDALAETNEASVTQSVPTMLEWLPEGCSKAMGVSKLCQDMGIDPSTQLLAIGDAENDVGMLKMASIGVAVGNACPIAQEAADVFLQETNDDGGAGAAMELFGFGPAPNDTR